MLKILGIVFLFTAAACVAAVFDEFWRHRRWQREQILRRRKRRLERIVRGKLKGD